MKVDVRFTEEERLLVPNFEERLASAQRCADNLVKDKRERFRVCLHEGGHTIQYRKQCGWAVKFYGPSVRLEDGEFHFTGGSVAAVRTNNYEPFDWQEGMVSIGGFWTVERFRGAPEEQIAIHNDLKGLRRKLGEDADMNHAVYYAKIMLEQQLLEPDFLPELERAVRDYELAVYGTDEATTWGWNEYRPELKGERCPVSLVPTSQRGLLIGDVLYVGGVEVKAGETFHGRQPRVSLRGTTRKGALQVVRRWNEKVHELQGSLLHEWTKPTVEPQKAADTPRGTERNQAVSCEIAAR